MRSVLAALAASTALSAAPALAQDEPLTGTLRVFSNLSDPAPRAIMEDMVARFDEMHPELEVELTTIDHEAYKTQIRNFLSADPPDVAAWFAGNRMRPYVDAGLLADVSDLWAEPEFTENLQSSRAALTLDDKQWGVPFSYYHWGVYYRQDIFEELGLEEPETWEQELANCQTLLDNDIKCYTIGSKFTWPTAGWFDYLNLRNNGYEFHMELASGAVPWTDERVRDTFAHWRELIDMGAYIDDHQAYSWQEAVPFMINGDAAAYLMGNFAVAEFRAGGLTDDQLGFYRFPAITEGVPLAEEAPTDTFHLTAGAQNPEAGREFMRFVVSAENQSVINAGDGLGQLPVNAKSTVGDDKFIQEGFATINDAYALAQFFDRDAPAEMAQAAMEGFQEFMVRPDNLEAILERLEQVRQRVY